MDQNKAAIIVPPAKQNPFTVEKRGQIRKVVFYDVDPTEQVTFGQLIPEGQLQPIANRRGVPVCRIGRSLFKSTKYLTVLQPEWWFPGTVRAKLARCHLAVMQTGQAAQRLFRARHNIPARLDCAKFGQGDLWAADRKLENERMI